MYCTVQFSPDPKPFSTAPASGGSGHPEWIVESTPKGEGGDEGRSGDPPWGSARKPQLRESPSPLGPEGPPNQRNTKPAQSYMEKVGVLLDGVSLAIGMLQTLSAG